MDQLRDAERALEGKGGIIRLGGQLEATRQLLDRLLAEVNEVKSRYAATDADTIFAGIYRVAEEIEKEADDHA